VDRCGSAYCRQCGIEPDEVLAVGDGLDYLTMLRQAGVAVAVRGGAPEAIDESEHLIDPPEAGGWARILDLVELPCRAEVAPRKDAS
jgi:hydroxymethylpyrimidine pyrophosphatase-like HAD family hydrolase